MKKYLVVILSLFVSIAGYSQSILMGNGTYNTCAAQFESSTGFGSGGAGTPGYTNNENYTLTFCPSIAGNIISVNFASFVMGPGDVLTVYNGSSTAAPLLGVYDATNPVFGVISAQSATNPGGCLTFHFVSDTAGIGNGWTAGVSCSIPCQQFTIETVSFDPDTSVGGFIDICDLDTAEITVTGIFPNNNLNYNQNDSNVSFIWYYDSTAIDTGTTLSFPPDSAGAFRVSVFATDSLGCEAEYNLNYWIRVSTEPDFTPTFFESDTICLGDSNILTFGAISQTWSNADSGTAQPTTFLPDGSGSNPGIYANTITFSKFRTGDTIASLADISKFWAVMEHTFLGDLSITISCPNGSSAVLKSFPGGGGTNLGEPCTGTGIGNGYLYEWKPTGNNQTNMINYTCGCPPVISPCTGFNIGASLPANSYAPFQTMNNLIGCPLNGTWTLTIVDQWAADDGYLFSWGVDLDSSLYPSTVVTYNPGIDSIWVDTAANAPVTMVGNDSLISYPQVDSASYCYTVNILDGFGCTHDTTICFFVRDMCDPACYTPVSPAWTTSKVSCPGGSDGSIIATPNPLDIPYPWTFIWTDNSGNVVQTTVGSTIPDSVGGLTQGLYHLEIIDGNGCSSNWSRNVGTKLPLQVSVPVVGQTSCAGSTCDANATAVVFYGTPPYSFLWSSGDTLSNATTLCVGSNMVTVTDAKGCQETFAFNVTEPAPIDASASGSTLICVGNSTNITGSATGGTPPYSYTWSTGAITATTGVSPTLDQSFTVVVTDANNCPADSADVTVFVRPPLSISFDSPDTLCPGDTVGLLAFGHGGDSLYNYQWEQGLGNTAAVQTLVTTSQFYTVTVTDACGTVPAIDSVWVQIGGYAPLKVSTTPSDTICIGEQFYMYAKASGGDGKFTYTWDNGLGNGQAHLVVPTQATSYTVTVVDECLTPAGIATINVDVGNFEDFEAWVDTAVNCDPGTFEFGFDTVNSAFNYELNFGKGYETVDPRQKIERLFTADGCHDVTVRLTSQYGCITKKQYPCMFKVLPTPIADFDFKSHQPDILEHYVDFWDKSKGATTWSWYSNGSDSAISTEDQFSYPFPVEGVYNIKLVVSNEFGCADSTNTDLPVAYVTTYYYPTAFTPDGNGHNEEFKIVGEGVMDEDYDLQIFDRWGGLVFKTSSKDQGWNGRMNNTGDMMMTGVYMYTYTLRLHDGRKITDYGQVHLLK